MVVAHYTSPFAPLSLSLEEKEQLSAMANQVVGDTIAMYEHFLWRDNGHLDPITWARVREREETRVYRNCLPGAGTGNLDMHLLLTVGHVKGSLNDAMYGVLNPTTEAFRVKTAYIEDTIIDMSVLESIVLPTAELPYESLTVRWFVKGVPLHVRLLSKHQDSVYIETTGMRQLSNGERIGVHLLHSVSFAKAPALPKYERFNMSVCTMWRQVTPDKVQSFMASYFEIKDSFKASMVIMSMADAVLSLWKIMECAHHKKLAWLVKNKNVVTQCEGSAGTAPEEGCSVCGSRDRSARRGLKSACAVCAKYTCNKCRTKRNLHLFAPDGQLVKHELRFCMPCVAVVNNLDGANIAKDDVTGGYCRSTCDGSFDFSTPIHTLTMSSSASSETSSQSGDEMRYAYGRYGADYAKPKGTVLLPTSGAGRSTRA